MRKIPHDDLGNIMLKNYIQIAIRILSKDKVGSLINIGGLAIGLATVIIIALFVRDELSYDNFWKDKDRIYRVDSTVDVADRIPENYGRIPSTVKASLVKDYSEIEVATRILYREPVVKVKDDLYFEPVMAADPELFEIFNFKVIEGNAQQAIRNMSSVILTKDMARKYFGNGTAIGNTIDITLRLDNVTETYQVAAIIENPPLNSHLDAGIILAMNRADYVHPNGVNGLDDWASYRAFYSYTYVKFKPNADIHAIEEGFDDFIAKNAPSDFSTLLAYEPEDYFDFNLINIQDIYLKGPERYRIKPGGDLMSIYAFIAIAFLILLISSINFINLTMAKSLLRSREISLRKILGAGRSDIIKQFLGETLVVMTVAGLIAVMIVFIVLPAFNSIVLTMIDHTFITDPLFQFGFLGLIVVVTLGAGFYPSFIISNNRPIESLRSRQKISGKSVTIRALFVILQFSVSIGLIISTLLIYQQTRYARSMDPGYQTDNIIVLRGINDSPSTSKHEVLRNRFLEHPDIIDVSLTNAVPFDERTGLNDFYRLDIAPNKPYMISTRYVDDNFFSAYEVPIIYGRDFDELHRLDVTTLRNNDGTLLEIESSAVLNEAAARLMGFEKPEDAIGNIIGWGNGTHPRTLQVIGIIPNIRLKPANFAEEPNIFTWTPFMFSSLSIKHQTNDFDALTSWITKTWSDVAPDRPLQYGHLTTQVIAAYNSAEVRFKMLAIFSGLAILISSLGLYAMATFDVQRRVLEIGIRKVFGASSLNITKLLIWQFSKPVMIANCIAWPITWYFMSDWLAGYSYRIKLTPTYFVLGSIFALIIAWLTVGSNAWRAARSNPIHSIKHE